MGEHQRWRGVPLPDLREAELLAALRLTLRMAAGLWVEVARRRLVRKV